MTHSTQITEDPKAAGRPDRNLALELVRVTEAAALAAARWVGMGENESADQAAVEGTRLPALGFPSALSVIAMAERGTMFDPGPCVYMEKIAGSEEVSDLLDLDRSLGETLKLVAQRKRCDIRDVMVVMLDRERHQDAVKEIRKAGARIRFITDGDVSAALLAVTERSPVDLLWGIGGTPEGVISAAAIKCIGGQLLGRLWPRNDEGRQAAGDAGYELDESLDRDRLVAGR